MTIDELAASVNIAKITFYTFYDNKELLYLDIAQSIQLNIFVQLESLLKLNKDLKNSHRVLRVFNKMYELMLQYPVLSQIDKGTAEIIARRVDSQRL